MSSSGAYKASSDGVVKNVKYKDGKISFTSGIANTGGNAVIVLKKGATILWSWHIWMNAAFDARKDQEYETPGYYGGTVKMMPYNLGAVNTSGTGAATNAYDDGLLYQWGRKDPFLGAKGYEDTKTNPERNVDYYAATDFTYDGAGPVNPRTAYEKPTTFYTNAVFKGTYDWSGTQYDNLWGNGSGTAYANWDGNNNKKFGTKTLFDPCPPGYMVPPRNTWSPNFIGGGNNPFNKGFAFRYNEAIPTFYPASGGRSNSNGSLSLVGLYGHYWTSSPDTKDSRNGGELVFNRNAIERLNGSYRFAGYSVRCARIE
jgi:hypothetical protein